MLIFEDHLMSISKEKSNVYTFVIKSKHISLDIATSLVKKRIEEVNQRDQLLFIDGSSVRKIDKAARDYFGSSESKTDVKAIALFSNSIFSTFLANFLISVHLVKLQLPTKLFFEKEKAYNWLTTI